MLPYSQDVGATNLSNSARCLRIFSAMGWSQAKHVCSTIYPRSDLLEVKTSIDQFHLKETLERK